MLYRWAMRPSTSSFFSFFFTPPFPFSFKKTPPVGLEPTTLRLKAARSTDWARKALVYLIQLPLSIYPPYLFFLISLFSPFFFFILFSVQKGLRRESNPGHPHPKRVFYHLTTKPFLLSLLLSFYYPTLFSFLFYKKGFGGNRTRATCTLSRYFTT